MLSVSALTSQNNIVVEFDSNSFFVKDKNTKKVILQGRLSDGLYQLSLPQTTTSAHHSTIATSPKLLLIETQPAILMNWHRFQSHLSFKILSQVLNQCMPHLKINKEVEFCSDCQLGKSHKLPFSLSYNRASNPLITIHSDIWGLTPILSKQILKYYIIFLEDHTWYTWIYPLKQKNEALSAFIQFKKTSGKSI